MRTILVFCLLFASSLSLLSQSVDKLDAKYGFKNFKFGQSLYEFDGSLDKLYPKGTIYKWTESEPHDLFGWDWSDMYLGFHKKKLVYISVSFSDDKELYKFIHNSLEGIFGRAIVFSRYDLDDTNRLNYSQWQGKKVDMDICHYQIDDDLYMKESSIVLTIRLHDIDAIIDEGDF